jgi:phosphoglycerate dehydrogenase-like enzyme
MVGFPGVAAMRADPNPLKIAFFELPQRDEDYLRKSPVAGFAPAYYPAALVWALDEGILCGAGLDVLEGEDMIQEETQLLASQQSAEKLRLLLSNHILRNRENVVVTPHSAFNSREALNRILDTMVENILSFASGRPVNVVTE